MKIIGSVRLACAVALAAVLFSNCTGFPFSFETTEDISVQTVLALTPLSEETTTVIVDQPLDIQGEDEYLNEDFDFINGIYLDDLTLTITGDSDGQDFSFLTSVVLFIEADTDGDGETEKVQIAHLDDPAAFEGAEISLVMTGDDVQEYVLAPGGYSIVIEATGSPPSEDVMFDGIARYDVSAGFDTGCGG